jgi:hypothetical protein
MEFLLTGMRGNRRYLMFSIMLTFKNYTSIVQKGWSQNENGSKIINDLDSKQTRDFAFKINLCMFHVH